MHTAFPGARFWSLVWLCLACAGARAETSLGYTYGSGSGDYSSHSTEASLDLGSSGLQLRLDTLDARSAGVEVMNQYGLGLRWQISPLWSTSYRFSNLKDTAFNVDGQELGLGIQLDKLWRGELETRLDLGLATMDYGLRANNPALSALVPDQRRLSLDLHQALTPELGVYLSYDSYRYSRDPVALARLLVAARRPRVNAAFTLVGFPDNSRTLGLTWDPSSRFGMDLSWTGTRTVLRQRQQTQRLAASLALRPNLQLTAAYSASRSDAVFRPNGTLLTPEDRSSQLEFGINWSFE